LRRVRPALEEKSLSPSLPRLFALAALTVLVAFAVAVASGAAPAARIDRLDPLPIPPGWAVRFTSRGATAIAPAADVTTHAEQAAFVLDADETPHPEVAAADFEAKYECELAVAKAGKYRFELEAEGGAATMQVEQSGRGGGASTSARRPKSAPSDSPSPSSVANAATEWFDLAPGSAHVLVNFRRDGSKPARLRTSWELQFAANGVGFASEPIPSRLASVPKEQHGAVARELEARRGRLLLGELGCANCHASPPNGGVEKRAPISLATVANRVGEPWLYAWIGMPQKQKPGCGMPSLLKIGFETAAKEENADFEALIAMLESLAPAAPKSPAAAPESARPPADPAAEAALAARGRELYHEVGCVACHGAFESPADLFGDESAPNQTPKVDVPAPFVAMDKKWRTDELATFLREPRAIRTHGRMPSLALDEGESSAIAHYLATRFAPAPARADVTTHDAASVERGKLVFNSRGCAQCHTLFEGKSAEPSGAKLDAPPLAKLDAARGCLASATDAKSHGNAPRYELDEATRSQLRAGLESVKRASGAACPIDATQRTVAALHCTACHERDGAKLAEVLQPYFKSKVDVDLGDEGRLAPRLDGVGLRLQSPWLEKVVSEGARARTYLWTRMPSFGGDVAASLAHGLAAIEGERRSDDERAAPNADATTGRRLAGSGGMNCITCHSFGARPSAGTPGLDFLNFAKRIRKEWWQRYALSPLRFKPGTRMPTFFDEGKSQVTAIDDGDATRQIADLWAWFEKAEQMPAPEGVPSGQRMVLDVGDRPKVFRTFLAHAGNRGIAVGFPAGLHFAFDAEQVRLCEAWRGEFLDVAPVWTGRGGNVAPQLGPTVWSAPSGPLLLLAPKEDPFALATWPTDSGRNHGLKFGGYRLAADGAPTFLYQLREPSVPNATPPQPGAVEVEESFQPDARESHLFRRTLRVTGLGGERRVCLQLDPRSKVTGEVGGRVVEQTAPDGRVVHVLVPASGSTTVQFELEIAP
jgi:mono/diheme cytochrome c family protein